MGQQAAQRSACTSERAHRPAAQGVDRSGESETYPTSGARTRRGRARRNPIRPWELAGKSSCEAETIRPRELALERARARRRRDAGWSGETQARCRQVGTQRGRSGHSAAGRAERRRDADKSGDPATSSERSALSLERS